jgi:hypothetical protein
MKHPKCEICREEPATSLSWFYDDKKWKLAGDCTIGKESYWIMLNDFMGSAKRMLFWITHMSKKNWFNAADFNAAIKRYQQGKR